MQDMQHRKHLFIALSRKGWGETSVGVAVARQVKEEGSEASVMVHSSGVPSLIGTSLNFQEVPDHVVPLFWLLLDERLCEERFDSIILCDYLTTDYTLRHYGMQPEQLLMYDVPLLVLDTWEYDVTGSTIDIYGVNQWQMGNWIEKIKHRLVPAPVGRLTAPGAYCGIPSQNTMLPTRVRRHIRQNLGLTDKDRAVLFCTAAWQHNIKHFDGERISLLAPQLLWSYLTQVDPSIRLIHVGPAALALENTDHRYLWMPCVTPSDFDRLLGSVDLFLSFNISATTIARAIASGVPIIAVQNSYQGNTLAEVEAQMGMCASQNLAAWIRAAVPLYPFRLWPLGHWHFLKPLLQYNAYAEALMVIELLDDVHFVETCRGILLNSVTRQQTITRQDTYASQARQLPTAAQLIRCYLEQG
jgi:hypothetical protein